MSTTALQHSTRIDLDADAHITVDWSVSRYDIESKRWHVDAQARVWRNTQLRSGVHVAVRALSPPVTLEVDGDSLEAVLAHLMAMAHEGCLAALDLADQRS